MMKKLTQWFYDASILEKQLISFGLVFLMLAINFFLLYEAVITTSAIRAYVGMEGLWSKFQKDSVYSLRKYTLEYNEQDYGRFVEFLKVPLGDKKARLELEKASPNPDVVYQGFIEGKNSPADVRSMRLLFKRFHNFSYLSEAIQIWAAGDALIDELLKLGAEIHSEVVSGALDQGETLAFLARIESINYSLAILENDFSYTLGEASRFAADVVFVGVFAIFMLFAIATILLIFIISGFISKSIVSMKNLANEIAKGNLVAKLPVTSKDELGDLTNSLNRMALNISETRDQLAAKNSELETKISQVEENTQYLEKIKTATLNLLEDLDTTKARLEEGKLKDEAILSSIGDGMIVVDPDEKIVLVNQRTEDMLGYKAEELLGEKWYDVVILQTEAGGPLTVEERPIRQAFLTQKRVSILPLITPSKTYYFVRKDKTRFPVEIVASPIILNGKLLGAVEVFRDITREKEIERVKTEFVSIASHQLRTPLSTINWYSEILLSGDSGPLTKDQKEYLNEIYRGNQRMIDLVNALLNVSRLEVGAFIVEAKPIDLSAVAKDVLNEVKPQITNKHIILKEDYAVDLPMVDADYSLARIIFQNLITNAVKYTPANGTVEVEIILKDPDNVQIKVSDNGIGIPKPQQEKIFTKLFRADNARETDPDGTGLGLYIIRSIIDQTNGKIRFESAEGKGTTFYITVPVQWMRSKAGTRKLV